MSTVPNIVQSKKWLIRYWWIVGALVLVVVITYMLVTDRPSTQVEKAQQAAAESTGKGQYAQAFTTLQKVEKQGATKAQQVELYGQLARAASNAGRVGEAIRYYDLRHKLDKTTAAADAYELATLYERTNNPADALAQYKLALTFAQSRPDSEQRDQEVGSLKVIIEALEAQQ